MKNQSLWNLPKLISKLQKLFIGGLLCSSSLSFALTMDAVADALAVPVGATYSANDWNTTQIAGIKWQHKGLKETPVSPFTRLGNAQMEGLGQVTIFFSGERTMVSQLNVYVGGNKVDAVSPSDFDKVMIAQFGKTAKLKKLRGTCKSESGGASGSSVYEIALAKKKPLFVLVDTDAGGNSPGSQTTSFTFLDEPSDRWACNR